MNSHSQSHNNESSVGKKTPQTFLMGRRQSGVWEKGPLAQHTGTKLPLLGADEGGGGRGEGVEEEE